MSARSSLHSALLLLGAVGCGHKGPAEPEGDPASVQTLAAKMVENIPAPAAARPCTIGDLLATPMTATTLLQLAHKPVPGNPEYARWIQPTALDTPAATVLLDPAATDDAKRHAAGAFLAAKAYVVYKTEMVAVPLALEVKELKRGAVGLRAIGYDKVGTAVCIHVFNVQNDKAVSEWAQVQTDKALVDPAVAKALRDDLTKQLLATVADLTKP